MFHPPRKGHTQQVGLGCQQGNQRGRKQYFRSENSYIPLFAKDKPKLMQLNKQLWPSVLETSHQTLVTIHR